MNIVDQIWGKCESVSHAMRHNINGKYISDWPLAFHEFKELLDLVFKYSNTVLKGKTFDDDYMAPHLLNPEGIDLEDIKRAEEPLRVHLYTLSKFAEFLSKTLFAAHSQRYETLYRDLMSDIQTVVSANEYIIEIKNYKKQCGLFKIGKTNHPHEPQRRDINIGRNPNINAFDRRQVIKFLFCLNCMTILKCYHTAICARILPS